MSERKPILRGPLATRIRERLQALRERIPFLQKVAVSPGSELTPAQKRLAEEFKRGIAEALGVPPEAIREEPIERWIRRWTAAFVKPTYWTSRVALSEVRQLGFELGRLLRSEVK